MLGFRISSQSPPNMKTAIALLSVIALSRAGDNEWTPIDPIDADRSQRSVAEDPIAAAPIYNEVQQQYQQPQYQQIPTTYSERVAPVVYQQAVPIPVRTPIAVGIQVPYQVPSPVPVEVKVPVPVVKTIPVPVDREVPYPVVKEVPYPVVRNVEVPVIKPYPVPVPIYKTKVIDHGTRHTYEYKNHGSGWW